MVNRGPFFLPRSLGKVPPPKKIKNNNNKTQQKQTSPITKAPQCNETDGFIWEKSQTCEPTQPPAHPPQFQIWDFYNDLPIIFGKIVEF